MNRPALAAALASLPLTAAAAQEAAPPAPPLEGTVVSELVVRPDNPGPAWWRVSDDDSAVYILVLPSVTVTDRPWDKTVLERRLKGANVFITPFELSLGDPRSIAGMGAMLAQSPKLLVGPKPKMQPKDPSRPAQLEEALTPAVRDRFVALRKEIGQPAERYAALSPLRAGSLLERDYRLANKLGAGGDMFSGGAAIREIEAMAKRNKVKVEAAWKLTIPPMNFKTGATDEPTFARQVECLDLAMSRMQAKAKAERATYLAWAEGDVRPMLHPAKFVPDRGCQGASRSIGVSNDNPALLKAEETFVADQAKALEKALAKPGRSVAVLEPLSPLGNVELGLLGKRGVLERLRAKGYEIAAPDVLSDQD